MVASMFGKVFGTRNDRELKRYERRVQAINSLERRYEVLSDDELKAKFNQIKEEVTSGTKRMEQVLEDSFAITREASKRTLGMRHFDVQLIGGMVLHEGKIAEMKTGEGKTLVATLPVVLNAMLGKGVHIVTVNEYLAKRDAQELSPLYNFLGYSVGFLEENTFDEAKKQQQYRADITYGTNNEYGFDYLRDNMKYSLDEMVQRSHPFVIVDEVDSILIDEARTPLIISGPVDRKLEHYVDSDQVAKSLIKDEHFTVDEKNRTVLVTEEGIAEAEKLYKVDNLYSLENARLAHHLDQALKSNYLFEKDVDYVVNNGEVMIVDEFTGRISEGRRFSDGLHQALEAKENVQIKEESQTLADITFQNYFRMYDKLAGMTGTAQTEATEFFEIYGLDVISIPTNLPVARQDLNDLIYKSEGEKFDAVVNKIKELNQKGQPVLVGTASIEKSEELHALLKKNKIVHTVLNAKQHEQEGEIVKKAGVKGAVTVATNMAGRGVDIRLTDDVKELGGLYIIGTERHENRRIDNQLRGRSGRQGDVGASQFYLSLEDSLLRIFGSDKIKVIMERLGIEEGEHIESKMVTRAVEKAQKKVENLHFEGRKHIVEYDDVANEQRKIVFKFRNDLLSKEYDIDSKIKTIRDEYVTGLLHMNGIFDGGMEDEFNLDGLTKKLLEETLVEVLQSSLENKEYDAVKESVLDTMMQKYEEKFSVIDSDLRGQIEREFYLKTLDKAWQDHLYQMDTLKTGIGLRGYNQKDPLTEYKKESFNLFQELVESIKYETIKTLHLIQFRDDSEEQQRAYEEQKRIEQAQAQAAMNFSHQEIEPISGVKKPSRNEPCPCGSGKKYKHCCGKSGPKKGVLAS